MYTQASSMLVCKFAFCRIASSETSGGLWDDRGANAFGNERPTVFRSYDSYA